MTAEETIASHQQEKAALESERQSYLAAQRVSLSDETADPSTEINSIVTEEVETEAEKEERIRKERIAFLLNEIKKEEQQCQEEKESTTAKMKEEEGVKGPLRPDQKTKINSLSSQRADTTESIERNQAKNTGQKMGKTKKKADIVPVACPDFVPRLRSYDCLDKEPRIASRKRLPAWEYRYVFEERETLPVFSSY